MFRIPLVRFGSQKEGQCLKPPPQLGYGISLERVEGERGREGCQTDSPPAASSAAGIFFLIIEFEV